MFARLSCRGCGAPLSGRIEIPPVADPAEAGVSFEDGKPLTRAGVAFNSSQPMLWSADEGQTAPLHFAPQHWLHPLDVDASVEPVDNPCRLNGCCGLDGLNGPNMRCRNCKAEVGTRQNDCWTCDVFIPEPDATRWLEEAE